MAVGSVVVGAVCRSDPFTSLVVPQYKSDVQKSALKKVIFRDKNSCDQTWEIATVRLESGKMGPQRALLGGPVAGGGMRIEAQRLQFWFRL